MGGLSRWLPDPTAFILRVLSSSGSSDVLAPLVRQFCVVLGAIPGGPV